jgi:LPS export ABC transporter protein LptC
MATETTHRVHVRPLRAIRAARWLLLVILAGVALALILTYGSRRGKPQATITMAPPTPAAPGQGPVVDQADQFEINGSREGRPAFTLRAHSVTGFQGDHKLLRSVHLRIHDEAGETVDVEGDDGQFDAAERRARLSGNVRIVSGQGFSMQTGMLYYDSDRDVIFTADEIVFTVGGIEGRGRGLNYLVADRQIKIPDQVRLEVRMSADALPTLVTSSDLVAGLRDNTAVFTGDVRMTRGGESLRGNYVKLVFDETRRHVRTLSAFGEVGARLTDSPGGDGSDLHADSLTARFAPENDRIQEVEATGGCKVTSGPYESRSVSAHYLRSEDRLELRGEPVVFTGRDRIAAQEIDVRPDRKVLNARGDVRTVSLPESRGEVAAAGFSGRSAVSFQAEALTADQQAGRAVYSGTARAWQEGNSIQADEIAIDQSPRQLRATGNVIARWTETRAPAASSGSRPAVTSITARSMLVEDARGIAQFRDSVRLTRPDATLTCDALDAFLREGGDRRDLQRADARGSVAVKRADSYGSARAAEYLADEDLLVLKDEEALAEVVDSATGRTMRGRTLTFDLAGDRILTESDGGRTWITLKPQSKDAPSLDPKTRH